MKKQMRKDWKNWTEDVICEPEEFVFAEQEQELAKLISKANKSHTKVRTVGSGHSFTKLCENNTILVDISKLSGIIHIEESKQQITFWAGTTVREAGILAAQHNLAFENTGDYDRQTLAGAISTGTHGTGITLSGMAKQIIGFTLITASGEILDCNEHSNTELFQCGVVTLGAFGIITRVTVQMVERYKLKCVSKKVKIFELLPELPRLLKENRNLEFFYFPQTEYAVYKESNICNSKVDDPNWKRFINQTIVENHLLKLFCDITATFNIDAKKANSLMTSFVGDDLRINYSNEILATERNVKFREMELNIPAEKFEAFFNEVTTLINEKAYQVYFPIEIRWVKQDDLWLSPTYKRDAVYLAFHTYVKEHVPEYFTDIQTVAKKYKARPHWGKLHDFDAKYLQSIYPKWNDFKALRSKLDPNEIFINDYLAPILGDVSSND